MSSFRVDLIGYLHSKPALALTVGKHSKDNDPLISWVTRPNIQDLPAITLRLVSLVEVLEQRGRSLLEPARVQFDLFGNTVTEIDKMTTALRGLLTPSKTAFAPVEFGSTIFERFYMDSSRDLPVEDLKGGARVYHASIDFMVYYKAKAAPAS